MSRDQLFDDSEARFRELWGPLAVELRPKAERKTMPSRHFLVRQACLNALNQHMPTSTREDGPAKSMAHLVGLVGWDINWPSKHEPSQWFVQSVHDHFSILVAQYA